MTQKQTLEMRQGPHSKEARRARTRTLIQVGGLVDKAGILDLLNLDLGQDLQKDFDTIDQAATLMGSLLFLKGFFQDEEAKTQKKLWCLRGKEALGNLKNSKPINEPS